MSTELQTEFETEQAGESQDARMLSMLKAAEGGWVSLTNLVHFGCGYATHSRAASLRKKGYKIENMVDRSVRPHRSFYRLNA